LILPFPKANYLPFITLLRIGGTCHNLLCVISPILASDILVGSLPDRFYQIPLFEQIPLLSVPVLFFLEVLSPSAPFTLFLVPRSDRLPVFPYRMRLATSNPKTSSKVNSTAFLCTYRGIPRTLDPDAPFLPKEEGFSSCLFGLSFCYGEGRGFFSLGADP